MENITFLSTMVPEQENTLRSGPEMLRLGCAIPLLLVATFGNVMSFNIMRRESMKRSSPGIYFAAIACTDTSTVYWGLVPFVVYYFTSVDLWTLHPWSCKIIIFMLFSSADSAIWLLVAVTVDRFIAVRFPMKKSRLCTPRKATITACALPSIAMTKNVHCFFTRGKEVVPDPLLPKDQWVVKNCGFPTPAIEFFEQYIRTWIGFSLYAFIPIILILILNIFIIKTFWKVSKVAAQSNREQTTRKTNNQLTAMLLSVSITFLVLIIPSITVLLIKPYLNLTNEKANMYAYIESVVDCMACLMHSSNFFLYCLTGPGFHRELVLMFNKRSRQHSREGSEIKITISTVVSSPESHPV